MRHGSFLSDTPAQSCVRLTPVVEQDVWVQLKWCFHTRWKFLTWSDWLTTGPHCSLFDQPSPTFSAQPCPGLRNGSKRGCDSVIVDSKKKYDALSSFKVNICIQNFSRYTCVQFPGDVVILSFLAKLSQLLCASASVSVSTILSYSPTLTVLLRPGLCGVLTISCRTACSCYW